MFFKDSAERFLEYPWGCCENIFFFAKETICTLKKVEGLENALNHYIFVWQKAPFKKAVNIFHTLN